MFLLEHRSYQCRTWPDFVISQRKVLNVNLDDEKVL